jgi:outer membrane protein TolC
MLRPLALSLVLLALVSAERCTPARGQGVRATVCSAARPRLWRPEQRSIDVRRAGQFSRGGVPGLPRPSTVSRPGAAPRPEVPLTLDEAIGTALENAEVIRVLAGVTATSRGQTAYDVAISNTAIDQQQARFDPSVQWQHDFNRSETPAATLDPLDPAGARIDGTGTDGYDMGLGVSKTTATGGALSFGVNTNPSTFDPGGFPLDPQNRYSLDMGYTQPLLRGGGLAVNQAPIVVARLDTERSFFQYKAGVQQLVRDVIAAYWNLVFARTDRWARQQQVQQAQFAYEQADARFRAEMVSRGVVAQARVSLAGFKSTLTAAENNVLQREAALRNLLGLPPSDGKRLVPVTPPNAEQLQFHWEELLAMAERNRPELIELKLVLEADRQSLLMARNEALPNVDANMLYRWNGLEGRTPTGARISTRGGQYTDWTLGVTFSVPLGLRSERAKLRRQELVIARDRANLRQGIHEMTHALATTLRSLDQYHRQYREFRDIRADATLNLQERRARWKAGGVGGQTYVEVLLAITDWGNTVSSEAQALAQYNAELANLELETGTILNTHGIRFYEERFGSIGPLGRLGPEACYARSTPAGENTPRYPRQDEPAENYFELDDPMLRPETREEIPAPAPEQPLLHED